MSFKILNVFIFFYVVEPNLSKVTWSFIRPIPNNNNLEVIFLRPKETSKDEKPPLVVIPHGGPHSMVTTNISLTYTTLVSLGYAVAAGILQYVINSFDNLLLNSVSFLS